MEENAKNAGGPSGSETSGLRRERKNGRPLASNKAAPAPQPEGAEMKADDAAASWEKGTGGRERNTKIKTPLPPARFINVRQIETPQTPWGKSPLSPFVPLPLYVSSVTL